jgi:putative transposase
VVIKTFFARGLTKTERLSRVRSAEGERIWQRRFWEHAIRNEEDYAAHMDYVHFNPVKHGLVATPAARPYSTFRWCVSRGVSSHERMGDGAKDVEAGEPGG